MHRAVLAILCVAPILDAATERDIAEWVLRWEGQVTIEGSRKPFTEVSQLPTGDVQITGIDLTAGVMHPIELRKLEGLLHVRELYLPGPIWNPGGGKEDRTGVFKAFATLTGMERAAFGWHYNAQIEIGDTDISQLYPWKDLKELRCSQCQLAKLSLAPFAKLESLDLSYNPFTDKGMEGLAGLTNLRRLLLRDTLVTDDGLKFLANLTKLEELDLSGARITDKGVQYLRNLKSMRRLNLLGAQITDDSMSLLAAMRHLQVLNLYRTRVTNSGLSKLQGLKDLTDVDLRYSRVTSNGLDSLTSALPETRVRFVGSLSPRLKPSSAGPRGASEEAIAAWVKSLGGQLNLSAAMSHS